MKKLKEQFKKNGYDYTSLKRNDKYALFEQSFTDKIGTEIVGYEVDKLRFNEDRYIKGLFIEGGESIESDDSFGTKGNVKTQSKQFFPSDLKFADDYYEQNNL